MKHGGRIVTKVALTAVVFSTSSYALFVIPSFVIDILTQARLLVQIGQNVQVIKNTFDSLFLQKSMLREVTHASFWKSFAMEIILNEPGNLYGETAGWGRIYTSGGNVNATWKNSTIPVKPDRYYQNGPGSTFAATTATAEIADATAEDSLASVQQFYRNKQSNTKATQSLQLDFDNPGNNTYLGQARITNGVGLQSLSAQQDQLLQQTNMVRMLAITAKQIRDQNTDADNFVTDLHRYQATQGVSINGNLAAEFQSYSIP